MFSWTHLADKDVGSPDELQQVSAPSSDFRFSGRNGPGGSFSKFRIDSSSAGTNKSDSFGILDMSGAHGASSSPNIKHGISFR